MNDARHSRGRRASRRRSPDLATAALRGHRYRRAARRAPADTATPPAGDGRRRTLPLPILVFLQYALLAADIRFVADANYLGIAVVNICIAINTWYLTRGVVAARTARDRWGYIVGGTLGALLAVALT